MSENIESLVAEWKVRSTECKKEATLLREAGKKIGASGDASRGKMLACSGFAQDIESIVLSECVKELSGRLVQSDKTQEIDRIFDELKLGKKDLDCAIEEVSQVFEGDERKQMIEALKQRMKDFAA